MSSRLLLRSSANCCLALAGALVATLNQSRALPPSALHHSLLACFMLIIAGRVVNILVPLAYKHIVDRLGAASSAAAAAAGGSSGGDPSRAAAAGSAVLRALCGGSADGDALKFWGVFWPWAASYLGLMLLQGSGSSKGGGLGLISNTRDLLWIPIAQRAYKRIRWA